VAKIAFAKALPIAQVDPQRLCTGVSSAVCARLVQTGNTYLSRSRQLGSLQVALETTGNRASTARRAHNPDALILQVAAGKVYSGQIALLFPSAQQAGQDFANALRDAGENATFTTAGISRTAVAFSRLPMPKRLAAQLMRVGITASQFKQAVLAGLQLATADGGPRDLASLFTPTSSAAGYVTAFQTIKDSDLAVMVQSLALQHAATRAHFVTLLTDLANIHSQCNSSGRPAAIDAFIRDVGTMIRGSGASLVQFAAQSLKQSPSSGCQ
jgi:hypothetical protein